MRRLFPFSCVLFSAIAALFMANFAVAAPNYLFLTSAEAEGVAVYVDVLLTDLDVSVSFDHAESISPLSGHVITTSSTGYGAAESLLGLTLIPASTLVTSPPGGTTDDQNLDVNVPLTSLGITGNISTVNGLSTASGVSTQSVHSSTATANVGVASVLDLGVGGIFNEVDSRYDSGIGASDAEAILVDVDLDAVLGAAVLSADVIESNASCLSDGGGGGADMIATNSNLVGLAIGGVATATASFPPNTSITIPLVAEITFNRVVTESFDGVVSGTVSAVFVDILGSTATVELARSSVICDVPGVLAVSMSDGNTSDMAETPMLVLTVAVALGMTVVIVKRRRVANI